MKKAVYLTGVIVVGLLFLTLYQTYAMFTSSVSSDTVINLDTTLNYKFKINTTQTFKVDANTVLHFNAIIENEMEGSIKYGIYHNYNLSSNTNVQIGEIVLDASTVTTSPNGTGVINASESKTVPIAIINNSNATIEVSFGITTGYTSNTLTYPANTYALVKTIDDDAIGSASCESNLTYNEEDCYEEIENGIEYTKCIVITGQHEIPNLDTSGANAPVLADGMIPVYWNGTGWAKADKDNVDSTYQWYDYNAKKWANTVMVTSGTRTAYMSNETKPLGTVIPESDILAYYVWIPRYRYQLFNVNSETISSKEIAISFENKSKAKSTGTVNNAWLTHPAFTLGTDELDGIWVGKFETTGTSSTPTIKPNINSLFNQKVSTQFTTSQKFGTTTYLTSTGVSEVDAHMMKNTEWGAVAYLKQSKYGLGTTALNYSNAYITEPDDGTYYANFTGCKDTYVNTRTRLVEGEYVETIKSAGCSHSYETTQGVTTSTTGNVYGIYDMTGNGLETVMGVMKNEAGTGLVYGNSGFNSSTLALDSKYVDVYTYGTTYNDQTAYNRRILGDATGETIKWDNSKAYYYFVRGGAGAGGGVWFCRGNMIIDSYSSSTTQYLSSIFSFNNCYGESLSNVTFRSVITNK